MILVDDNQYALSYSTKQATVLMSIGDESTLIMDIYTASGVSEVSTGIVSGSVLALSILNGYSSSLPLNIRGTEGSYNSASPNPIFTQGMDLLYRAAADQEVNWGNAESEIAGFSGVRVVHPEVSIVAAKPVINISTTLGIVTGMRVNGAALDALSRISSAILISPDTGVSTKGFMYLSGYEGSYLEEKAFEDVLGVESISTMKLLRLAAGQGIIIVTINQHHISIVYCTPDDDPTGECAVLGTGEYKIIHASGMDNICYGPSGSRQCNGFSRKTTITLIKSNIRGELGNPIGFGRIILWK